MAREKEKRKDAEEDLTQLRIYIFFIVVFSLIVLIITGGFLWFREYRKEARSTLDKHKHQMDFWKNWNIKSKDLTFVKKLAAGAEGEVWKGKLHGRIGDYAIKKAINTPDQDCSNGRAIWDEREVSFMMLVTHENLVEFIGAGEIRPEEGPVKGLPEMIDDEPVLFMVQEYMDGGSIDNYLHSTPRTFLTWAQRIQWAEDIAQGLEFIHGKGFAHRDLKSPNVLYEKSTMRAKVADFGLTTHVSSKNIDIGILRRESALHTSSCGTPQWMAPELCKTMADINDKYEVSVENNKDRARQDALRSYKDFKEKHGRVEYGKMVDVYAYGCVLFEISEHKPPWAADMDINRVFTKASWPSEIAPDPNPNLSP